MSTKKLGKYVGLPILLIWALISLFPLYWLLIISLKPGTSVVATPPDLSWSHLTLANFENLFQNKNIWRWTFNSLIIAISSMIGNIIFCSMAGYVFAKKKFPGEKMIFWLIMCIMMTSTQVIMVPLFMLVRDMGLMNSYLGLILPVMIGPFAVFLTKQFIQTIPNELIHAATIDGCSEWGVFQKIIIPLSSPVLAIVAIFTFVSQWNDFLWPLLVTESIDMRTLQTGMATLQLQNTKDYGLILAGSVWTILPILIVFFAFQRFFIKGITVGAVKG